MPHPVVRTLRTAFLFFLLLSSIVTAAERPFDFGLVGRVAVLKAEYWMDGGSVTAHLRDEHGNRAAAHYQNVMWPRERHGGQFGFRSSKAANTTFFRKHGSHEAVLF
jgi:hypothetical protein